MTQAELELEPRCKPIVRGTQHYEILMYLKAGGRLTVAKALTELGIYALSQRCGELRRQGWPIQSTTKKVGPHVWVSEYFLES
jgi:Helix-turn-helix domain